MSINKILLAAALGLSLAACGGNETAASAASDAQAAAASAASDAQMAASAASEAASAATDAAMTAAPAGQYRPTPGPKPTARNSRAVFT